MDKSGAKDGQRTPATVVESPAARPDRRTAEASVGATGRPAGRRRLSRAALLLAPLLLAAAALGAVVAPGPEPDVAAGRAQTATSERFAIRYPANWSRVTAAQVRLPGLELRDQIALAPQGRSLGAPVERALVAGRLDSAGGALPQELLSRLPRTPQREAVELGAVQGYRYGPLTPRGFDRQATLYVIPTSGDTVVAGCLAPAGSVAFLRQCERVASTLRLRGATAVALAPSPIYARSLNRIVARLTASRSDARRRLRRARTRSGQAGNAARLSGAYRRASRSAGRLTPPPGARDEHAAIVAALKRAGSDYRRMARAARSRANGRWSDARAAALSAERDVQGALRSLAALGYQPRRAG